MNFKHGMTNREMKLTGWMPFKMWLTEEAQRESLSLTAIWRRLERGCYRGQVQIKHVNARVVMVRRTSKA